VAGNRVHIVFPADFVAEIDATVGRDNRSAFMREAIQARLVNARQRAALEKICGTFKEKDYPEWQNSVEWVRNLRGESSRHRDANAGWSDEPPADRHKRTDRRGARKKRSR
jgi:Arc/MetJ-type ribon-helix-helix transcriptional regulator